MSKITEKLDAMRGGGHHVPVGLDEVLLDIEGRLEKLEGKKPKPEPNPLDGERSDS
jgi:hypothetical protein